MTPALLAGVARQDFSIPDGTPLCGFASRREGSQGTLDPIGARAIAVSSGDAATIIVVADLTTLSPAHAQRMRESIARGAGLDPSSVVVCVTHTHAAPNIDPRVTAPAADPAVIAGIEQTVVDTAQRAWGTRAPAAIAVATGTVDDVTANRRRPDGPTDPTLSVCRLDLTDGSPLAVLFGYACHPTVLSGANHTLSADWPGAARQTVEAGLEGTTALFVQGFCGDCNTGHSAHSSMGQGARPGRSYSDVLRIGQRVGGRVLDLARSTGPDQFRTDIEIENSQISLKSPDLVATSEQIAAELARAHAPAPPQSADAALAPIRQHWAERMAASPDPCTEQLVVSAHRWGDIVIACAPGEPFSAIARDVRSEAGLPHLLLAGYSNGVHGYIPYPPVEYSLGGYEVTEAHLYYGRPSAVPPTSGGQVVEALVSTIQAVTC